MCFTLKVLSNEKVSGESEETEFNDTLTVEVGPDYGEVEIIIYKERSKDNFNGGRNNVVLNETELDVFIAGLISLRDQLQREVKIREVRFLKNK